jgi:poly-gamma-glutamate synthesis protein (capsule biosynthesis protein)
MAKNPKQTKKRPKRPAQTFPMPHRRSNRQKQFWLGFTVVAIALAIFGISILLLQPKNDTGPTTPPTQATAPNTPIQPPTQITIAFGGDINITDKVVAAGKTGSGYDYSNLFKDVAPVLAGADAAVVNLEGNLYGEPFGTKSTSAPKELMTALHHAGVDFVQMANSCVLNNGLSGLRQTLSGIRENGMEGIGAFADEAEFEKYRGFTLTEINGVKVAFVAFTKGMNGLSLPDGKENLVNLLYKDYTSTYSEINTEGITKILRSIQMEKPDITIALLHWGSTHNGIVSDSQKEIVDLMQKEGVSAIIGTHSHYVQDVEFDPDSSTLVAYSLGDFVGDADKHNTNASTILQLQITKDHATGVTSITGYHHTPVYIATPEVDGVSAIQLLRIRDAIVAYEVNSILKVSDETYAAMKAALNRISARVDPEE